MNFLNRIFVRYHYKKIIKVLDKISDKPDSISDFKTRALTCENIIQNSSQSDLKIIALTQIKNECELIAEQMEFQLHKDYLSKFEDKKGYDKYIQVGGREFAQEIWFHRDKTKISVLNKNIISEYVMYGEIPGYWYKLQKNGVNYDISVGKYPPTRISISIEDKEKYDSFKIDLIAKD